MKTLGVGILGLHHLHPVDYLPHFEALPQTEVKAIAEADGELLNRVCDAAGLQGYTDSSDLLGRDDVDLVMVFLPHAQCPEAVVQAAGAGKHVIVEKPMAATSEGIRKMVAAADKAGVCLSAPYCWRNHPASRQIKRLVDDGALGRIIALEARLSAGSPQRYRENGISPWILEKAAAGGGAMHNLGVHWVDLFRWILQDEVETVTGMVSSEQHHLEVEDNSFALLRFNGGATAMLDISYSVPAEYPAGRDIFVALRGTHGAISWSPAWGGANDEVFLCSDRPDYVDGPVQTLGIASRAVAGYGGISGLAYLRETVEAIASGRKPEIGGVDGLRALEVAEAVYESAACGHTVTVDYSKV